MDWRVGLGRDLTRYAHRASQGNRLVLLLSGISHTPTILVDESAHENRLNLSSPPAVAKKASKGRHLTLFSFNVTV